MDLSLLAVSMEAVPYHLLHPSTFEPLFDPETKQPVTVDIFSTDGPRFRDRENEAVQKRLDRMVEERKKTKKASTSSVLSAAEQDAEKLDALVACIAGWQNVGLDGKPLKFSPDNARKLLSDNRFRWMRLQLEAATENRANFLPSSPTT
jgi:hypothetical protein